MSPGLLVPDYAFEHFDVLMELGLLLLLLFFALGRFLQLLKQPIMLDLDVNALLSNLLVLLNYLQILSTVHYRLILGPPIRSGATLLLLQPINLLL